MLPPTWHAVLDDHVSSLDWSPDGNRLVVGSLSGDALVLDTADGATTAKLAHHHLGVLCAAWSPDGTRLALGGQDGVLRLADPTGDEIAASDHDGWVTCLAWSPSSGLLAAGANRTLLIVRPDGTVLRRYPPAPSTITSLAWTPDGTRVGIGAYGGVRWYIPGNDTDGPAKSFAWKGSLLALVVAPNTKWACAGSQDATVHLWRLWSGSDLSMSGYAAKIEHLAFHHRSRWMANSCLAELTVWCFAGKGPAGTEPAHGEAHDQPIADLTWQPGGEILATGDTDGRLALWATPKHPGEDISPLDTSDAPGGIARTAWSPDGARLAVGRSNGTVEVRHLR